MASWGTRSNRLPRPLPIDMPARQIGTDGEETDSRQELTPVRDRSWDREKSQDESESDTDTVAQFYAGLSNNAKKKKKCVITPNCCIYI
ncbi:hypothetical protein FKM82_023744 [Ascaphus truei]